MSYLNSGLTIRVRDERDGHEGLYQYEGGIRSFVAALGKGKTPVHPDPIYILGAESSEGVIVEAAMQYPLKTMKPTTQTKPK